MKYEEVYSDRKDRKSRGVFYTPEIYVSKSTEYVRDAIGSEKNYVVIDRACGTGNLEAQFSKEELSHFILGTLEPEEAKISSERLGVHVEPMNALSRDGVLYYRKKIQEARPNLIIFLENPPYLNRSQESQNKTEDKENYVLELMKNTGENTINSDLDYCFIWSVYNIYHADDYIHYGPIKCWKSRHLLDKEVKGGYLCDKQYFNASIGAIPLIYWGSKDIQNEYIDFDSDLGKYRVKKVYTPINRLLPQNDTKENSIISIMCVNFSNIQQNIQSLIQDADIPLKYGSKQKYVSKEHLLYSLPVWVAAQINYSADGKNPHTSEVDFRVIETENKCSDGGTKYQNDTKFLQDCLLYTTCTHKYVQGLKSDGIFYKTAYELLDDDHKHTEIYTKYQELVSETGINGLKNIEKVLKKDPRISELKHLLSIFQYDILRPKMLEYELLK